MIKKVIVTSVLFYTMTGVAFSQKEQQPKRLPSVFIGAGILSFNGDIGKGLDISSLTRIRSGFTVGLEQRFGKVLGVSLAGVFGKVANSDHGIGKNLNFESPITQGDLNLVFHFDNDFIFKNTSIIAPYLQAGISFVKFDPHSDLTDKNGIAYNYWADGTIRSLPETSPPSPNAVLIQRDYTYETQLKDPNDNYKRSSLALPMAVGFKLNATQHLALNIAGTYYLTFTDRIDNVKSGKADSYLFGCVTIEYKFFKKEKSSTTIGSVDFAALDKSDLDEDGVPDKDDNCMGTEKGVTVDSHGCPIDTDEDGIPDYKDKEVKSAKGALVDESGVTMTDKAIAEKNAKMDSTATERSQIFNQNPSLSYLKSIENQVKEERKTNPAKKVTIPPTLQFADKNKDGLITTTEITGAIDAFFDGNASLTIEKINSLIDFFFEQ
jgi:hypothetical protein